MTTTALCVSMNNKVYKEKWPVNQIRLKCHLLRFPELEHCDTYLFISKIVSKDSPFEGMFCYMCKGHPVYTSRFL